MLPSLFTILILRRQEAVTFIIVLYTIIWLQCSSNEEKVLK